MQRYETMMDGTNHGNQRGFPRHQTIEFAPTLQRPRGRPEHPIISEDEPQLAPVDSQHPATSDLSEFLPSISQVEASG